MAVVLRIPTKQIPEQSIVVLTPKLELADILRDNLGDDVSNAYNEVVYELENKDEPTGDDYEAIADGYYQMLMDTWNELEEILNSKRIDRKRLENLYEELGNNL